MNWVNHVNHVIQVNHVNHVNRVNQMNQVTQVEQTGGRGAEIEYTQKLLWIVASFLNGSFSALEHGAPLLFEMMMLTKLR